MAHGSWPQSTTLLHMVQRSGYIPITHTSRHRHRTGIYHHHYNPPPEFERPETLAPLYIIANTRREGRLAHVACHGLRASAIGAVRGFYFFFETTRRTKRDSGPRRVGVKQQQTWYRRFRSRENRRHTFMSPFVVAGILYCIRTGQLKKDGRAGGFRQVGGTSPTFVFFCFDLLCLQGKRTVDR